MSVYPLAVQIALLELLESPAPTDVVAHLTPAVPGYADYLASTDFGLPYWLARLHRLNLISCNVPFSLKGDLNTLCTHLAVTDAGRKHLRNLKRLEGTPAADVLQQRSQQIIEQIDAIKVDADTLQDLLAQLNLQSTTELDAIKARHMANVHAYNENRDFALEIAGKLATYWGCTVAQACERLDIAQETAD